MGTLQIKKLNDLAVTPTKGTDKSAGCDLYSIEKYTLKPLERKLFKTGLSMAIPSGMYGRIAPRSGLSLKNGIDIMAGVIDEDYRQEVGVVLINLSDKDIELPIVKDGKETAIAQIIFEFYNNVKINVVNELNETSRVGGFGSSDLQSNHPSSLQSTNSEVKKKVESPKEANGLADRWKKETAEFSKQPTYESAVREREKRMS